MVEIRTRRKGEAEYDVCIIGSGAAGGTAAKVLTEGGMRCVLLEAGPPLDVVKHYPEHKWPYELPHRGAGVGGAGYTDFGKSGLNVTHIGLDIEGEPYTSAQGSPFVWLRARILGGRTNHWTRVALRMSEADFKPRSLDGVGNDWPIIYKDLARYYEKVEASIGVYGTREGIATAPDGIFQPPPKPRCSDLTVKQGCDRLGIPCIPGRAAILTQPLNGRPPCHYCQQCVRGCRTASTFSSSQVMIPAALATGRLTLICNAMTREIVVGEHGKAAAVVYVDKTTGALRRVRAKAFVVAASACESARLLLNSKSKLFPQGLANSSGVVGGYLMDTPSTGVTGYFPQLAQLPPHNDEGTGSIHMYVPWWRGRQQNDFLRGYHIEIYGGRTMPGVGMFHRVCRDHEGYGISLKQRCKETYGTFVRLEGRGEMIANEQSYCEIDPDVVDAWGIPVLRFHFTWGENEIKMAHDMVAGFKSIIEAAGGIPLLEERRMERGRYGYLYAGGVAHEVGTVRMGADPQTSAVNGFCQAHDVRNVFVTDGACFATNPDKNPTLTILALSWRASEYILEEARKGNI